MSGVLVGLFAGAVVYLIEPRAGVVMAALGRLRGLSPAGASVGPGLTVGAGESVGPGLRVGSGTALVGRRCWVGGGSVPARSIGRRVGTEVRLAAIGLAAPAGVGWVVSSPALTVCGPVAVALLIDHRHRSRRIATRRELVSGLPEVLDRVLQAVRSGVGLGPVCADLDRLVGPSPAVEALGPMTAELARSRPLGFAARCLRASPEAGVRLIGVTLEALVDLGGPTGPVLTRLRHTLAGAVHDEQRRSAQSAQAAASASMLSVIPLVFAGFVAAIDPGVARFYVDSSLGAACLLITLGLGHLGRRWMGRIAADDGRQAERRSVFLSAGLLPAALPPSASGARRAEHPGLDELVSTIDLVSLVVAAGGTVTDAVKAVAEHGPAPVAACFADVSARWRAGAVLADALAPLSEQLGPTFHPLVGALLTTEAGGAPVAGLLHRLGDDADHARRRAAEARAGRLPAALLPPLVVCHLPAVLIGAVIPVIVVSVGRLAA